MPLLVWRLWLNGLNAALFGEASMALGIPFRPFYWILALGMLLYALVLVVEIPVLLSGGRLMPGDSTDPDA